MATKYANIKGIAEVDDPTGTGLGFCYRVTFDCVGGTVYTGGSDTLSLGGGGTDQGVTTSATLATLIQNRRRDNKTVTIQQAMSGPAGGQAAATNGPLIYTQSNTVSAGNVTCNLFSAATSGSAITTTSAAWDRAASLYVFCTAV